MAILTPEQVGAYWILAGGPVEATADAISEAYVESGFDTNAKSSAGCLGLWQGCPPQASYTNPLVNAKMAVGKYRDGGNSFVKHWTNWQAPGTEAKRLAYLPRAKVAAARVQRMNSSQLRALAGGATVDAGLLDSLPLPGLPKIPGGPSLGDPIPDNPLSIPKEIVESISNMAEIMRGVFETWLSILGKIADPDTWKDAGKILLGIILLYIGAKRLFTITTS